MDGHVSIGGNESARFAFKDINEKTYITFAKDDAEITFHVQVPDYDVGPSIARKNLPEELRIAATAEAIIAGVVKNAQPHLSVDEAGKPINGPAIVRRDFIKVAKDSPFSNVSGTVQLKEPIWSLGSARTHAVWATRTSHAPIAKAV